MNSPTCCICDPNLPLSPHVCAKHKLMGLRLAKKNGTYYSQAAGDLYREARFEKFARCFVCNEHANHFSECGGGALICDDCVRAGKCCGNRHVDVPGITVASRPALA